MMHLKYLFTLTASAAICVSALADVEVQKLEITPEASSKEAYFKQKTRLWGTSGYKASADKFNAIVSLTNSKTSYVFHLLGEKVNGQPKGVQIGMLRPSVFNWYAGGFIQIRHPRTPLLKGDFSFGDVKKAEDGSSAWAEFKYTNGQYSGIFRFELFDDDSKLHLTYTPSDSKHGYDLSLVAYPGTYGDKKLRQRKIMTAYPAAEDNGLYILNAKEYYAILYDAHYDRSKGLGQGCCAALFNPQEINSGRVRCGYAATIYLTYKAGQKANLILWDFKNWSSKMAEEYMKGLKIKFQ